MKAKFYYMHNTTKEKGKHIEAETDNNHTSLNIINRILLMCNYSNSTHRRKSCHYSSDSYHPKRHDSLSKCWKW